MTTLTAEAIAVLAKAGLTGQDWAWSMYMPEGKWAGDECGCPDERCRGYHHDADEPCDCLPGAIEAHLTERAEEKKGGKNTDTEHEGLNTDTY